MINVPTFFNPRAGVAALGVEPQKRSLYAGLFDRLNPTAEGLEDDQKKALFRQGLLSLGTSLLSNGGGFGSALGQGI
ncbi:MAG TPA: hypothetical protein VEY92_08355 [Pseudoxanthomonas sp.]|nr:hypothetical protein [Pseudoxanthomonas sp.]